jgi:hypothetical protein
MSDTVTIKPSGAPLESYLAQLGLRAITICGVKAAKVGEEWRVLNEEIPERPAPTEAEIDAMAFDYYRGKYGGEP